MSKLIFPIKYLGPIIWALAILIRLSGAATPAQPYDIGTFHAWANHIVSVGPRHFFDSIWSDYLPLPILTFGPIAWLTDLTGLSFGYVFKLVYSSLELILIYLLGRSLKNFPRWPVWLLLLSPALIGDVAFWGQLDPIPALLALLSFTTLSPITFGLAVAFKPIMILLAPILWLLAIKAGKWWQFPLFAALTFLATGLPTGGLNFVPHLISRVLDQVGTYPFTTINGWNLWSLVPSNYWLPDSTAAFGISAHSLGLGLFFLGVLILANHWRHSHWYPQYSYRVAATLLILFYAVTTRMHERHLLFGLPFLTLAACFEPWLLLPLSLLTGAFTLNLYSAFYWVNHAQTWPVTPGVISAVSWLTTLTALGLTLVWHWPSFFQSLKKLITNNKILVSILIMATLLRFVNLAYPSAYIFDEVYHAFTAREYLHNHIEAWEWWTTPPKDVAYEWTHPPVAKYGMVLGMLLLGENSLGWRAGSAAFGVISLLGLYLLVFALTKNKPISLLSAFLVSIEGLHISQSRIAMNDIYLLAFYIWALYAAAASRWKSAAILYGLALASKWSALYGIIPLAFIFLHDDFSLRKIFLAIRLCLIVVAVYILTFTPFILAPHTWAQWWELHRQMWYYHTHLVATHAYQSAPLQWLFAARPVWYYVKYLGDNVSNLYAQANPLILWFGLVALIMQFKKILHYPYSLFFVLYSIFTLPWIFSPRIMFFYHYLPSATFLCVLLAAWLSGLPPRVRFGILVLCFFGFIFISPTLYGFPMSHLYWNTLFNIVPSWK